MHDASRPQPPHGIGKNAKTQMADIPTGLWQKCPKCRAMLYIKELERDLRVCHNCQNHFPLTTDERIALLADEGSFTEFAATLQPVNPLEFPGYEEKLDRSRAKAGQNEAFVCGDAVIAGVPTVLGVANFSFMGGSMGSVVGEKVARTFERGVELARPVVIVCASGGARMQEGMLSLMQMAKTAAACERLKAAGQLYITILTDPTTGGVWASFGSLGDIIISEPGVRIGLTGPRVLEQSLKIKLPPGTNSAEFQLSHGMIDMVVHRRELRSAVAKLLTYLTPAVEDVPSVDQMATATV